MRSVVKKNNNNKKSEKPACEKVVKSTLSKRDIRLSVLEPAGCSAYLLDSRSDVTSILR